MKVTVSIVNYKVPEYLLQSIASIEKALEGIDSEIIIVDNHSEDDSQNIILSQFPNVHWIQNQENIGFGSAHNQALEKAKGEFVAIINPDVIVSENIFTQLINFSENKEQLGIVGLRMENEKGEFWPESKRNPPTLRNALEKELKIRFLPDNQSYYAHQVGEKEIGEVPVLSGAFMWMRNSVFQELEGFDPRFFMFAEDIDMSVRALQKGYQNYYYGDVSITHAKGESAKKNQESRKHFYHTMLQYIDKQNGTSLHKIVSKSLVRLAYWKERNW